MGNRLRCAKFHENVFSINKIESNFCPPFVFKKELY